jgi:outer membrane lipoprotein SlyB
MLALLLSVTAAQAQVAGESLKLEYGTVDAVKTVQAQGSRAGGTIIGGLAGAAIAHDHRGLGMIAGGLLGGGIEKRHTSKDTLEQYTVKLMDGGVVVIVTEQENMVVGDCVVVEQGQYANIRRVSSINCAIKQQPEHHVSAASNCQKAKDELNNAKTDKAIEQAVIKVRTLCED